MYIYRPASEYTSSLEIVWFGMPFAVGYSDGSSMSNTYDLEKAWLGKPLASFGVY